MRKSTLEKQVEELAFDGKCHFESIQKIENSLSYKGEKLIGLEIDVKRLQREFKEELLGLFRSINRLHLENAELRDRVKALESARG